MTKLIEVYKCDICGNMVEVVHDGPGVLSCCGKPMRVMAENTVDAAKEKHIPEIKRNDNEIVVKVGSIEHPMIVEHYIEWIEVITENKVYRKNLQPGEKPEAVFEIDEEIISVREYCSIHGLWALNL